MFGDNIVPNGDSSTRNLAGADVEVKSGGYQHCLSRQGTLSGVKVRTRNDDRVRSLQRSDLLSVVAARDISLQSRFCAPTRALQAGQIQVKQYKEIRMPRLGLPEIDVKTLIEFMKIQSASVGNRTKVGTQN